MRFCHMGNGMSQTEKQAESTREWLSGLFVVVATVVAFIGFAFASLKWTLVISSVVLVCLVIFLWLAGVRKQRARREHDARR